MPKGNAENSFTLLLFFVGAVMLALFAGCDGGGSSSASTATLRVALTDRQSDAFQQVVVAVREVRLVPAGLENVADDDPRLPVVVTYNPSRSFDILTLHFQQEVLGTVTIPVGSYNQLRLVLEPNPPGQSATPVNYLTLKTAPAVRIPLTTPSAQQSGLKVLGQFQVRPGVANAIAIDFDPNTAIVARGNGAYNLKPTGIRIVQTSLLLSSYGSLSGQIVSPLRNWSSATISVIPPGSTTAVAASTVFSSFSGNRWVGPFSAFAPPGTYRVHISAPRFANFSTPPRSVVSGSDTPLGDLLLR